MRSLVCSLAVVVGLIGQLAWPQIASAQSPPPTAGASIEVLVRDGWEVTGYVAASDIRTLILFRHKSNPWLVQCSVLIDVTRSPRQIITCYELR